MVIKISSDANSVTYFDTEALKKYDIEIGYLANWNGQSYDLSVIVAWVTEYSKIGETDQYDQDAKSLEILDYWFGEDNSIEDAIYTLKENQKFGKVYPIKF